MTKACAACPWRKSNHGKPHPHGWYAKKNLQRLWAGLRTSAAPGMTCHPTDVNNEVPEGHHAPKDGTPAKECAGALLLVTRELKLFEKDPKGYKKARGRLGLTREGLAWWGFSRVAVAGTFIGGDPIPILEEDQDIGL